MKTYLFALASGAALLTSQAQAAIPVYPNPGTINPIDYSFTAASRLSPGGLNAPR